MTTIADCPDSTACPLVVHEWTPEPAVIHNPRLCLRGHRRPFPRVTVSPELVGESPPSVRDQLVTAIRRREAPLLRRLTSPDRHTRAMAQAEAAGIDGIRALAAMSA